MKKIFFLLALLPSLLFGQGTGIIISNRAVDGSIHIDTLNRGSKFILKQTTALKKISIPNANTGASAAKDFWIKNAGSVSVTLIPGGVLDTAQAIFYSWSGTKYAYSSAVSGPSLDSADFLHKINNLADLPNKTTARTNLGVAIGTNVQAFSSTLQSWASISPSLKQDASSNLNKWTLLDTTYATTSRPGRLSQADWINFNSKQAGSAFLSKWALKDTVYATSARPGQLSSADWILFNAKASAVSVAAKRDSALASGKLVIGQTYGGGLAVTPSGDATISNAGVITNANTAVTPASYTNTSLTVDSKGRITLAATGGGYKGNIDLSTNPNYPSGIIGDVYRVSVLGKIGGVSGKALGVGDRFICIATSAGGTEAAVGENGTTPGWMIIRAIHPISTTALTAGSTVTVDFGNKTFISRSLSDSRTNITFASSNNIDGAECLIEFSKTTATNDTLTFTGAYKVLNEGLPQSSTSAVVSSSTSGIFIISLKMLNSRLYATIKNYGN